MGSKKDKSYKTFKPRGPLLPPNKRHKSNKDYDRQKSKLIFEKFLDRIKFYGHNVEEE